MAGLYAIEGCFEFRELAVGVRFEKWSAIGDRTLYEKTGALEARCLQDDRHRSNVGEVITFDSFALVVLPENGGG